MKSFRAAFLFCIFLGVSTQFAHAQPKGDVTFGVGTATAPASSQGIDTFGTGELLSPPKLNGAFGKIGADIMLTPHFGMGAEYSFRFAQGNYAGLNYRPSFYDFNAIIMPTLHTSRIQPEFQAGLGGANLRFYYNQSYCDQFVGCSNSNSFLESSNHFQLHGLAAVRFYVTPSLFIRPEVDIHWVNNFFQFGSDFVPQYGASIGYSFGR